MRKSAWQEKVLKELCETYPKDEDMLPIAANMFGWTIGQAYIATEPYRRPKENYN